MTPPPLISQDFEPLLRALSNYQEVFFTRAYGTMGFQLLVLGWFVTSERVQRLIESFRALAWAGIGVVVIGGAGCVLLACRVQAHSQQIFEALQQLDRNPIMYEHHRITKSALWVTNGIQVAVAGMTILLLAHYGRQAVSKRGREL